MQPEPSLFDNWTGMSAGPASSRRSVCAPGALASSLCCRLPPKGSFTMLFRSWLENLKSTFDHGYRGRLSNQKPPRHARLKVESLEDRLVPSTFTVLNTLDSGAGSFRAALTQVNADSFIDIQVCGYGTPRRLRFTLLGICRMGSSNSPLHR